MRISCLKTIILLLVFSSMPDQGHAVTLSNDSVRVVVDDATGNLTVTDRIAGRVWGPDPWQQAAGLLEVTGPGGSKKWNLSDASDIVVTNQGNNRVRIVFHNSENAGDMPAWAVTAEIVLRGGTSVFALNVTDVEVPDKYTARTLQYPARPFALQTDVDRGFAAIPSWQGMIMPSYIFPMNGGKFCMWDDIQYGNNAVGELEYYGWHGLTMRWFGTCDDKSAALAVIPEDGSVKLQYIANYNDNVNYVRRHQQYSPWPRILALTPVWRLDKIDANTEVEYHLLPGGDYVTMAKRYKEIAQRTGLWVSLEEKARKNPDVNKLKGAIYTGIYGGYPHYINMPGMAFTFDQVDDMVQDMREELGVKRAFIHAWGTFSNYAPVMWPISEELGGAERLKEVVDRIKGYGWLYSSYHSYVSLLEHDPKVNFDWLPKDDKGKPILSGRWRAVDQKHWADLARDVTEKERAVLNQNADITDIAYISRVNEDGRKLAEYLGSTGLVLGTERGNEWLVPWYHMLEGMVSPYNHPTLPRITHPAPLFNLVYHDAITNFGKIQDNNMQTHGPAGDYYIKTLKNMAYGDGPMVFFAPYEYEGVRPYLKFAAKMLSPLHESIAFEDLVDHKYLSPDFLVQFTKFGNGVEIIVNLGPTPFTTQFGLDIPGYGFRILQADGTEKSGRFHHAAAIDGWEMDF
jgi:hypothetical protein